MTDESNVWPHLRPFELGQPGARLRGAVHLPDEEGQLQRRRPTVVLLHGFTGHRVETGFMFVQLARAFTRRGLAAVTFDFLHSGESDGRFDQMLVSGEVEDALRVTDWLRGQPFVDNARVGLLGFSLGGLVASCTIARRAAYHALALIAPTTEQNLSRYARGSQTGESVQVGPHMLHPRFFEDLKTLDSVSDLVKRPVPTLLVRGGADAAVPAPVSQRFVDALADAGVTHRVEAIREAEHSFNRPAHRRKLIDAVEAWFVSQLDA